jgi:hypothetical protein
MVITTLSLCYSCSPAAYIHTYIYTHTIGLSRTLKLGTYIYTYIHTHNRLVKDIEATGKVVDDLNEERGQKVSHIYIYVYIYIYARKFCEPNQ